MNGASAHADCGSPHPLLDIKRLEGAIDDKTIRNACAPKRAALCRQRTVGSGAVEITDPKEDDHADLYLHAPNRHSMPTSSAHWPARSPVFIHR